jgi:hypothetical protein
MSCRDVHNAVLTEHARMEMHRRGIDEIEMRKVLMSPGQREEVRPGRCVYQSRVAFGDPPQAYLLRVFVDVDREPPEIVTAYRTTKVRKYWR